MNLRNRSRLQTPSKLYLELEILTAPCNCPKIQYHRTKEKQHRVLTGSSFYSSQSWWIPKTIPIVGFELRREGNQKQSPNVNCWLFKSWTTRANPCHRFQCITNLNCLDFSQAIASVIPLEVGFVQIDLPYSGEVPCRNPYNSQKMPHQTSSCPWNQQSYT